MLLKCLRLAACPFAPDFSVCPRSFFCPSAPSYPAAHYPCHLPSPSAPPILHPMAPPPPLSKSARGRAPTDPLPNAARHLPPATRAQRAARVPRCLCGTMPAAGRPPTRSVRRVVRVARRPRGATRRPAIATHGTPWWHVRQPPKHPLRQEDTSGYDGTPASIGGTGRVGCIRRPFSLSTSSRVLYFGGQWSSAS